MRILITLFSVLLATPAMAHEIASHHAHAGPAVLIELPYALLLGFGLAAAITGSLVFVTRRAAEKAKQHDPR